MENLEIDFLAGNYVDYEIPFEKGYLLKYFKTEIQLHFLKYYFKFNTVNHFTYRTGFYCSDRYLYMMQNAYFTLEKAVRDAKRNFDFETLEKINAGKYRVRRR